jgi:hypothetical protein
MKNIIRKCKSTGKVVYPSESSATRALNKYSDIQRIYPCEHCETPDGNRGWHTTHLSEFEMEEAGLEYHKRDLKPIGKKKVRKELNKLLKNEERRLLETKKQ